MSANRSGLGALAVRGVAWRSASSGLGKVVSFLGQWVLGYLLEPESFGIFALALSIVGTLGSFQDAGVEKFLLQDPSQFAQRAPASLLLSRLASWLSALAILGAAALFAVVKGNWHVFWVTLPLALAAPIGASRPVLRASLDGSLKFREAAAVAFHSNTLRVVLTTGLAASGWGAMSLSLPHCATAILELVLLRRHCPKLPRSADRREALAIFVSSKWIMLARFLIGVINQGDYLVLSLFWSSGLVGAYYFGYSLMGSLTLLLGIGMKDVILPVLSRMREHPAERALFYTRGVRAIVVFSAPFFVAAAAVAEPVLALLWQDKWIMAAPAVQAFALSSAFLILSPVTNAALETLGLWRLGALSVGVHALGTLLAAGAAALTNDLALVAALVAAQHAVNIIAQLVLAGSRLRAPSLRLLLSLGGPLVLCLPGWVAAEAIARYWSPSTPALDLLLRASAFVATVAPLLLFTQGQVIAEVSRALLRKASPSGKP